jgi:iron complex transport system permease protein
VKASRHRLVILSLAGLLAFALLVATAAGSVPLPFGGVVRTLAAKLGAPAAPGALDATAETILLTVRLPRVLLAALVGGGLAVVGAVLQAVFRNPLADSGLLGIGAGAALGAVLAVHVGLASAVFFALPLAAFAGALAAVLAVYFIAGASGRASLHGLLLTGIAVSALAGAMTSVLLVATEEFRVKTVLFWLAGGLDGRGWAHVQAAAIFVLLGTGVLVLLGRPLDVLSLGESEAASLGLPVRATRLGLLGLAALVAGACTAAAGSVPFVGLMAPHALRPIVGPLSRRLLPAAFLGGALLVVLADLGTRTLSARHELPLGALTACVGAPYFLAALRANEGRG